MFPATNLPSVALSLSTVALLPPPGQCDFPAPEMRAGPIGRHMWGAVKEQRSLEQDRIMKKKNKYDSQAEVVSIERKSHSTACLTVALHLSIYLHLHSNVKSSSCRSHTPKRQTASFGSNWTTTNLERPRFVPLEEQLYQYSNSSSCVHRTYLLLEWIRSREQESRPYVS
jgi:hypothetical protein